MTKTPLQQFVELLELAHEASQACDDYDIVSTDIQSVTKWNGLVMEQYRAFNYRTTFCASNRDKLVSIFENHGAS